MIEVKNAKRIRFPLLEAEKQKRDSKSEFNVIVLKLTILKAALSASSIMSNAIILLPETDNFPYFLLFIKSACGRSGLWDMSCFDS